MKYADPLRITCDECGRTGEYPVRSLLSLNAECASCSASLSAAGQLMREAVNDNSTYFRLVEATLDIEDQLSIDLPDADISEAKTVTDLVTLAAGKTRSPRPEVEAIVVSAIHSYAPSGRDIRPETLLQTAFQEYEA